MKVIYNVEFTPEGHTIEFKTEDRPLLENGSVDVVVYKKMLEWVRNNIDTVLL